MKISKYLHSCLVFEKDGFKLLFDPGKFSFAEGRVKAEMFADVDAIIITHNHPDHLDAENLKKIIEISGAILYSNAQVVKELEDNNLIGHEIIQGEMSIGPFHLQVIDVVHEQILDSELPDMQAYIIDEKVLHPADSFEEKLLKFKGIDWLVLPIMAPFTTELAVAKFADKIKPKNILPVHDGYARDFFVKQRYENYQKHFDKNSICFVAAMDVGVSFNV